MGVSHLPFLIILAVVALIVFGPKRLPELGHGLGKAITEFKKGTSDLMGSHEAAAETVQPAAVTAAPPVAVSAAPPVVLTTAPPVETQTVPHATEPSARA
ncbi:MAG: twin-arginine translocase TatA/TatE family subunit [Candidatus Dormibacteraeota bacterium]|nr:twin-arginine translocase TatA/TatE family subunit [Candidatus Dormibacteraeota bacterium]